jgi:excisionase family DNA binding protein
MPHTTAEEALAEGTFTVQQAMEFTGLSRRYLYERMKRRELLYVQTGRVRRVPRKSLIAMLARNLHGIEKTADTTLIGGSSGDPRQ